MRQYRQIKARYPNAILLFRMGDFYETFEDDAVLVSKVLGITLTRRANGKAQDVPLAGFPHHALDTYLPRLVQAGYRVAICEQLEDPKYARKVVKRDVVEVVTPGVSFHDHLLDPQRAHYLAAVVRGTTRRYRDWVGVAFADASTGEFCVTEVPEAQLPELLQTLAPAELLYDKRQKSWVQLLPGLQAVLTPQEDWVWSYEFAYETLIRHFRTQSLKGFGVEDLSLGLIAAGAVLYYLSETQKGRLPHIHRIQRYAREAYIMLDVQTQRNLELVASMQSGRREGTLIQILDHTLTPMGGRLLRKWLLRPLRDVRQINRRLDAVEELFQRRTWREALREELQQVGDLERLTARVCTGRATPRDLHQLRLTLRQLPPIKTLLEEASCETLQKIGRTLRLCTSTRERLETVLVDEPPATLGDGGLIRPGVSEELDELRAIAQSGKDWLERLRETEVARTGIPSLKIGYNKVFGYYIEVTNAHREKVPGDYIRKQTLVNAERYITPALKEYEERILTAQERIQQLETTLFNELRLQVAEEAEALQQNGLLLAMLDTLASFATVAERHRYTRPQVHEGLELEIREGRHPVVEQTLPTGEPFIPNSIRLHPEEEQIAIITGPNMAGKSVILRQTGLIVLLAQVGCFVPAEYASIGVVDKIFTRVGASDNLAAGESTFLVEMQETANILNNASPRSLILLDEVGRGTSTFDGLSIAWALVEYLHEQPEVAARTLFATHYHELNALAERYPRVRNFRVQVEEREGKVLFLRKLVPGGADHSYGIEVARMAGIPEPVIERAREILHHLESQQLSLEEMETAVPHVRKAVRVPDRLQPGAPFQLTLFDADPVALEIKERLARVDPNRITPIEALLLLADLRRLLDGG